MVTVLTKARSPNGLNLKRIVSSFYKSKTIRDGACHSAEVGITVTRFCNYHYQSLNDILYSLVFGQLCRRHRFCLLL